jgi:D-alanyl-D-alanine carboxypeptidase
VSGSEERFAISMTRRARALGMTQSVFRNASGLPDPGQVTSARDMVILARAVIEDFPEHLSLFSMRHFTYQKLTRPTVMGWLRGFAGAEGLKTGFTCGSGYNLLSAAKRDGRRLIGVVLGARSSSERNARMTKLMDEGFAITNSAEGAVLLTALRGQPFAAAPYVLEDGRCPVAATPLTSGLPKGKLPGWGLVFGSFSDRDKAHATIRRNRAALEDVVDGGRPAIVAKRQIPPSYSALLVGLEQQDAGSACRHLQSISIYCLAVPPKLLNNPQALWR